MPTGKQYEIHSQPALLQAHFKAAACADITAAAISVKEAEINDARVVQGPWHPVCLISCPSQSLLLLTLSCMQAAHAAGQFGALIWVVSNLQQFVEASIETKSSDQNSKALRPHTKPVPKFAAAHTVMLTGYTCCWSIWSAEVGDQQPPATTVEVSIEVIEAKSNTQNSGPQALIIL